MTEKFRKDATRVFLQVVLDHFLAAASLALWSGSLATGGVSQSASSLRWFCSLAGSLRPLCSTPCRRMVPEVPIARRAD